LFLVHSDVFFVWAASSDISGEYGTNVEIDVNEAWVWFIDDDYSGYQIYLIKDA